MGAGHRAAAGRGPRKSLSLLRLLEILGQWYEKGKVLIFVKGQGECDDLFRDLLKARRPHGRAAPH